MRRDEQHLLARCPIRTFKQVSPAYDPQENTPNNQMRHSRRSKTRKNSNDSISRQSRQGNDSDHSSGSHDASSHHFAMEESSRRSVIDEEPMHMISPSSQPFPNVDCMEAQSAMGITRKVRRHSLSILYCASSMSVVLSLVCFFLRYLAFADLMSQSGVLRPFRTARFTKMLLPQTTAPRIDAQYRRSWAVIFQPQRSWMCCLKNILIPCTGFR